MSPSLNCKFCYGGFTFPEVTLDLSNFTKYEDVKSTIVWTYAQFQEMLEFISKNEVLGFDLETDGTNPRRNDTMGIGIANLNEGYYLPLFKYNKETDSLEQIHGKSLALDMLKALEGKKLVAWNGGFEDAFCSYTLNWDFTPHFYSDQMLMLHLLDENKYTYGLKENGESDFGSFTNISLDLMLASMKENGGSNYEYYKADPEVLGHYCVWDCALTVAFYLRDLPKLKEEGLEKFFFDEETMPVYKYVVTKMEQNGILLDDKLLIPAYEELKKELQQLECGILEDIRPHLDTFISWFLNKEYPAKRTGPFAQAVIDILQPDSLPRTAAGAYSLTAKNIEALTEGPLKNWLQEKSLLSDEQIRTAQLKIHGEQPTFNIASKDHLGRLFFGALKEQPLSFTPKKKTGQINDIFLDKMALKYEWAKQLQTFNRLSKLCGTYYERFINRQENGRFYPQYFAHRTTTGRQSGDFQQLPRPLSEVDEPNERIRYFNNKIRAFFIADPGYKFLDADYESLEVMVFADDSEDPILLDTIRKGKDFYSEVAIGSFNMPEYSSDKKADNFLKKLRPEIRQDSKAFALGFRYGEDPYRLHMETGWAKKRCDEIHRNYFNTYRGLKNKMDFYTDEITTKGYVRSKAGRKRREPKGPIIRNVYGLDILNSLELWKKFHDQNKVCLDPRGYAQTKDTRRTLKSIINNALNFPIQSMGASIVSRAAWNLAVWLKKNEPKARIVALIHDQCIVMCPDESIDFVRTNMKRIMENTTTLSVPLIADPQVAVNMRDGH